MISGIVTGLLLAAFIGITVWAWSARRRPDFERAANAPLSDEPPLAPCCRAQREAPK